MDIKDNKLIGRICSTNRGNYTIYYEGKEINASLKGKFFYDNKSNFPVVGDYVKFYYNPDGNSRIEEILPRKSILKRADQKGHSIGYVKTMMEQLMVSNFDYVFILTSLNEDYSLNRIARYISLTLDGGGIPVVILTKSDLCMNLNTYIDEVKALSSKVKVHAISSINKIGLEALEPYFKSGITIALLGSSGVGKSTLVNTIVGKEVMKTKGIREKDSKGKHTTTSRELMVLENGVVLIDTPGMRELGMLDEGNGLNETFPIIEELLGTCRFSDCKHESEPGCAILKAIEDKVLSIDNWNRYKKLNAENSKHIRMMKKQMDKHLKKKDF